MKEGDAPTSSGSNIGGSMEVVTLKAHVAVKVAITGIWKNQFTE